MCETCVDVCPVEALKVNEEEGCVEVDYNECIRCFCCEEVCPRGAMTAKVPFLGRLFGRKA
jgi:Fe-S-cluster-containing dehydrogenase component